VHTRAANAQMTSRRAAVDAELPCNGQRGLFSGNQKTPLIIARCGRVGNQAVRFQIVGLSACHFFFKIGWRGIERSTVLSEARKIGSAPIPRRATAPTQVAARRAGKDPPYEKCGHVARPLGSDARTGSGLSALVRRLMILFTTDRV